jgi:hypothetical protein
MMARHPSPPAPILLCSQQLRHELTQTEAREQIVRSTISQEPVVGQVTADRGWEEECYPVGCAAAQQCPAAANPGR